MTRNKFTILALIVSLLVVLISVQPQSQAVNAQDSVFEECAAPSWQGSMWANADFSGAPTHTLCRRIIHFDWGGGNPMVNVGPDNFSTRWDTTYTFPTAGKYLFTVGVTGGVRLMVNNQIIIDSMENIPGFRSLSAEFTVPVAGAPIPLMIEGAHWTGDDKSLHFNWFLTEGGSPGAVEDHNQIFSSGPNAFAVDGGNVWDIELYQNKDFSGDPIGLDIHVADGLDYDYRQWEPNPGIYPDNWSARYTRTVDFPAGTYTFTFRVQDRGRVLVDGQEIINHPLDQPENTFSGTVTLTEGRHTIVVEHTDFEGQEFVFLTWDPPVGTMLWPDGCNAHFTHGLPGFAELCPNRGPATLP